MASRVPGLLLMHYIALVYELIFNRNPPLCSSYIGFSLWRPLCWKFRVSYPLDFVVYRFWTSYWLSFPLCFHHKGFGDFGPHYPGLRSTDFVFLLVALFPSHPRVLTNSRNCAWAGLGSFHEWEHAAVAPDLLRQGVQGAGDLNDHIPVGSLRIITILK